jgi:hypothetical protein
MIDPKWEADLAAQLAECFLAGRNAQCVPPAHAHARLTRHLRPG